MNTSSSTAGATPAFWPTRRSPPRSFAVFSFGKTYHATGWKVGYCAAPAALTAEFRRVHQFNTFTTTTPLQYALADYLAQCPGTTWGFRISTSESATCFFN